MRRVEREESLTQSLDVVGHHRQGLHSRTEEWPHMECTQAVPAATFEYGARVQFACLACQPASSMCFFLLLSESIHVSTCICFVF